MQSGGGSVAGEPVDSPLERLKAFYKMQYESGGQIGGLASSEPPAYQVKQAQQAAINMKKNPLYQAKRMSWDTNQAMAIAKEREAIRGAAMTIGDKDLMSMSKTNPELARKIKQDKSVVRMEKMRQESMARMAQLSGQMASQKEASRVNLQNQIMAGRARIEAMKVEAEKAKEKDETKYIHQW